MSVPLVEEALEQRTIRLGSLSSYIDPNRESLEGLPEKVCEVESNHIGDVGSFTQSFPLRHGLRVVDVLSGSVDTSKSCPWLTDSGGTTSASTITTTTSRLSNVDLDLANLVIHATTAPPTLPNDQDVAPTVPDQIQIPSSQDSDNSIISALTEDSNSGDSLVNSQNSQSSKVQVIGSSHSLPSRLPSNRLGKWKDTTLAKNITNKTVMTIDRRRDKLL